MPVLAAVTVLTLLVGSVFAQTSGLSPSDRSFIEEHFRAAKNFEASQKYDQAANEYELILSKYPAAVPRVYQNLGLAYYLRGKYDDAVKTFEKGLRMAPEMIGARLLLGRCYLLMEQPEKALPPTSNRLTSSNPHWKAPLISGRLIARTLSTSRQSSTTARRSRWQTKSKKTTLFT